MSYQITFQNGSHIIIIKVFEDITEEILVNSLNEASQKGKELKIEKFLYDIREVNNKVPTFGEYNIAYGFLDKLGFKSGTKFALLVSSKFKSNYKFSENVINNAGYLGKLFTDELKAKKWLIG